MRISHVQLTRKKFAELPFEKGNRAYFVCRARTTKRQFLEEVEALFETPFRVVSSLNQGGFRIFRASPKVGKITDMLNSLGISTE